MCGERGHRGGGEHRDLGVRHGRWVILRKVLVNERERGNGDRRRTVTEVVGGKSEVFG
jgi:predicted choloylglycine hydrolase